MNNSIPVVEVKDIYKSFKSVKAVRGVSMSIHDGQFLALLGPNGAGKTTMVEMIEGIQKPDSGEIRIMGKTWHHHKDELHHLIGLSLQETRFIDKLNVRETLSMFASFYGLGINRVNEIVKTVGLSEKAKAYTVNLSGGQRQRLALGIALLNYPKILLLDEPTTGLDPNARREIWAILLKLKEQGGTSLILTTHYMEEAEKLCDYIIVIDKGKILKEGTRKELLEEGDGKKIVEFSLDETSNGQREFFINPGQNFNINWDENLNRGTVALNALESELPIFLELMKKNDLPLKDLHFRKKTLDDLFIELTGRHLDE